VWATAGTFGTVQARRRPAGATAFGPIMTISSSGASRPRVVVDADGDAVAAWSRDGVIEARALGINLLDWGATAVLNTAGSGTNVDLAITPGGTATAIWQKDDGSNTRIQSAQRSAAPSFAAGSWSSAGYASPSGVDAKLPQVAVDTNDRAAAVWYQYQPDAYSWRVQGASRPAGGIFAQPQPLSGPVRASYDPPNVAMSPGGDAVAVWDSFVGAHSFVQASRRPAGGTFGEGENLAVGVKNADESGIGFERPFVSLDREGNALAAWVRSDRDPGPTNYRARVQTAVLDAAPPTLTAVTIPDRPRAAIATTFAATATDVGSAVTLTWDFGDGTTGVGAGVTHTYAVAGTYTVRVTATDAVGNATSATRSVEVGPPVPVPVPDPDPDPDPDPTPAVGTTVKSSFKPGRRFTIVRSMVLRKVPAGATVRLTCKGKGCPFKSKRLSVKKAKVSLTGYFKPKKKAAKLTPGARIQIRVVKAGMIGRSFTYTIRKGKQPKRATGCLAPDTTRAAACT
jgi:hypothetical protein